jgi:hypothetical protein
MENPNTFDGDGFLTDAEVAALLSKHPKSLKRWDRNPKLKALGWPAPFFINVAAIAFGLRCGNS